MSEDDLDRLAAEHVISLLDATEQAQAEYTRRQLETPFARRTDWQPFIALPGGTSDPLPLELRPYYVPADGLYHTGLFDPHGAPDALPFRSSERGYKLA